MSYNEIAIRYYKIYSYDWYHASRFKARKYYDCKRRSKKICKINKNY